MTQSTTALQLREMILRGELAPGERVREAEIAERLGISRMPVRQALPVLANEGLLVRSGQRGFAVRAFSAHESIDALRLRALMEGYAARRLAERGASDSLIDALKLTLADGDALFSAGELADEDEARYGEMNARFHALVLQGANIPLLESFVDRCNVVPFASTDGIAFAALGKQAMRSTLFVAHRHHHAIFEAIFQRQGDRAEFLFREHALSQERSISRTD